MDMGEVVTNLADEFEFYLGEQLAKYQNLFAREGGENIRTVLG